MAQTVIRGPESTENVPSSRAVRDVGREIHHLDPSANPFTLMLALERDMVATNVKFEWFEKDLAADLDQVNNAAGYSAAATAIVVDNATYFHPFDIVKNLRTAEQFRVTAVTTATQTLTIVRGTGSTAAAAMVDNDDLLIIGTANPEGASVGEERSWAETNPFDYTEIFRDPFGTTGSEAAMENYTGDDRTRLRREWAIEHKLRLERAFLFGERNKDATDTGKPIRYTGGFLYWATENITDAGGTLTEPEMETFCENVFKHTSGSGTRSLMCASGVISVIDMLAVGRLHLVPKDNVYGMTVKQWATSHGDLMIVKHRLLKTGAGGSGYGGYALAVEPKALRFRYLRGRNTKLLIDRQNRGDDKWTDEYFTEAGLEFRNPKLHGVLKSVTA